jgi:DNA-binding response OmpR family regulator
LKPNETGGCRRRISDALLPPPRAHLERVRCRYGGERRRRLHLTLIEDHAVLILDVKLAKKDSRSVIRDLRASGKPTPAVFLTTHDFVPDNRKDLNLGTHDYLMKPFAFSELLERLESILRSGPFKQPEIVRIADLEVDFVAAPGDAFG